MGECETADYKLFSILEENDLIDVVHDFTIFNDKKQVFTQKIGRNDYEEIAWNSKKEITFDHFISLV